MADKQSKPDKHSKTEAAAGEISDWMAGAGAIVLAVVALVLIAAFIASIFWT